MKFPTALIIKKLKNKGNTTQNRTRNLGQRRKIRGIPETDTITN
jgi:hypothetical protein